MKSALTPKVTAIPATRTPQNRLRPPGSTKRRRVAAYARVSTDLEEQATSQAAQVDYYTTMIQDRADWEFAGIYTDEGISGTSTKHRAGFQTMISDALGGSIDLILTKSVSRFARNTVDSLTTVRSLKEAGVEVFFEKENIWTLDSKGELLITIMSSLAQEESRSISENVTWGHRKRFADGKVMVPYSSLLGYKKGKDGNLAIDEEQAVIVRRIYTSYLAGTSPAAIARALTEEGIPTPRGKKTWTTTTIRSILTNEKYKGDALLQKAFTVDFLTKKTKPNQGELPQYYVTGNHEAIIDPAVWEHVQSELARRKTPGTRTAHPFASAIRCGQCGGWFGRKTWHSTDKYAKHIWRCNAKYEKHTACATGHVTEQEIQDAFTSALERRLKGFQPDSLVLDLLTETTFNTQSEQTRLVQVNEEIEGVIARMDRLVATNASSVLDQDDYDRQYNALERKHQQLDQERQELADQIRDREERERLTRAIHEFLSARPPLEYSPQAWNTLVSHAQVDTDGTITVYFKDEATN